MVVAMAVPVSTEYFDKFGIKYNPYIEELDKNILRISSAALCANVTRVECGSKPVDCCKVTQNTTFIKGEYNLPRGIVGGGDNVFLDCNGSTLIGTPTNETTFVEAIVPPDIVKNCIIKDYKANGSGIGIHSDHAILINNTIMNSDTGINTFNNSILIGNKIINNILSIKVMGSNNIFINNTVYNNSGGITAMGDMPIIIHPILNNTFINNNISYNSQNGMELRQTHNNKIIGNYLEGNGNAGIKLIVGSVNNTVVGNYIEGNDGSGIDIDGNFTNIESNKVILNQKGIFITSGSYNTTIRYNDLISNYYYGIYISSANNTVINNNFY